MNNRICNESHQGKKTYTACCYTPVNEHIWGHIWTTTWAINGKETQPCNIQIVPKSREDERERETYTHKKNHQSFSQPANQLQM